MSQTLANLPVGSLVVDSNTKYYNSPIVWMVLEHGHDGTGTTTLLTEKIVTLKAFDAKEPNNSNNDRKNYGNNRYAYSNILSWLNSEKTDWYRNKHSQDQAPDTTNVSQGPYNTEAGFLNGFSYGLKKLLKTVGKTTAKNTVTDSGGSEVVYSKIFLLSNTEVGLANENNIAEGTLYSYFSRNTQRIAYATQECIDNVPSGGSKPSDTSTAWYWWLRSPFASYSYYARIANNDGTRASGTAYSGDSGVRPACSIPSDTLVSDDPDANGYYTLIVDSQPSTVADLPIGAVIQDKDTKYYGNPINWKIIGKNHDGANTVTLLTEDIIALKCFDGKESSNPDSNRQNYGNNRYKYSNLLQWLNKSDANWYEAQHTYDAPPSETNVRESSGTKGNPYDSEAGFLAGFNQFFTNALQSVEKTTALNTVTDGGGSETVTSKIFLLSNTEVGLANENSVAEGTLYDYFTDDPSRVAYPNQKCIDNSNYPSNPTAVQQWYWWLRSPNASDSRFARNVTTDGTLSHYGACFGSPGVRPACVIPSTVKVQAVPDLDGIYTIVFNSAPTLTIPTTSYAATGVNIPVAFTVNDSDENFDNMTVTLDGVLYKTYESTDVALGVQMAFLLDQNTYDGLTLGSHTLVFTATDTENASTSVTVAINKAQVDYMRIPDIKSFFAKFIKSWFSNKAALDKVSSNVSGDFIYGNLNITEKLNQCDAALAEYEDTVEQYNTVLENNLDERSF